MLTTGKSLRRASEIAEFSRQVEKVNRHNANANRHNAALVSDMNRRLRAATTGPRYTLQERQLADRVQLATAHLDDREWDLYLAYAKLDGSVVAADLCRHLESFELEVWFDELAIVPGRSQSRQMDIGLARSRAGIAVLTPAFIAGRFWTERELGALLGKATLIPVLHGVTFEQVAEYSGILPDLAGFETSRDTVEVIAEKIAAAVVGE